MRESRRGDRRAIQPVAARQLDGELRQGRATHSCSHQSRCGSRPRASAAAWHVGGSDRLYGLRVVPEKVVNPWIVAIAVMFATFMEVLDTTVVNVSLPHIASS